MELETLPLQSNAENAEAKTCDGRNEKSYAKTSANQRLNRRLKRTTTLLQNSISFLNFAGL